MDCIKRDRLCDRLRMPKRRTAPEGPLEGLMRRWTTDLARTRLTAGPVAVAVRPPWDRRAVAFGVEDFFFHYTTRDAAFGGILPSGKLRMSRYSTMRDPLENKDWRWGGSYWVEPDRDEDEGAQEHLTALYDFIDAADKVKASARLLSLTIDAPKEDFDSESFDSEAFSRGWARARMWEQYAEAHAGVCLLFEREELTTRVRESLLAQDLPPPYHRPVEYTPGGTASGRTLDLGSIAGKVTTQLVADYIENNHDDLFFLKSDDWRTEFEYRFVVTAFEDSDVSVEYGSALRAVIVGERFPDWQLPSAIESCKEADADPMRLDWSMGRPLPVDLRITG
jgi:hypothetical protein